MSRFEQKPRPIEALIGQVAGCLSGDPVNRADTRITFTHWSDFGWLQTGCLFEDGAYEKCDITWREGKEPSFTYEARDAQLATLRRVLARCLEVVDNLLVDDPTEGK